MTDKTTDQQRNIPAEHQQPGDAGRPYDTLDRETQQGRGQAELDAESRVHRARAGWAAEGMPDHGGQGGLGPECGESDDPRSGDPGYDAPCVDRRGQR